MAEASKVLRFEPVTVASEAPPQAVYDTVADLKAHLDWSGERATDDDFKCSPSRRLMAQPTSGPPSLRPAPTSTAPSMIDRS